MVRTALVALLVVCTVLGTAIGGAPALQPSHPAQPSPAPSFEQLDDGRGEDVEMLGLAAPARSAVVTRGVDVSTAVSFQRGEVGAAIDRRALEVAFERTEDEQARRELLLQAATDVEIAIASLRAEQREVREDYVNGTITSQEYARNRTTMAVRAEQLRADLEVIRQLSGRVPQFSMRSRLEALRVALTGADGPVTDRVRAATVGESPPIETYLAVSSNGRVMAVVSDDGYVREAYRSDVWTPDTTSGIGFGLAEERMSDLYPLAFNSTRRNQGTSMVEYGAGILQISMEIREGEIVTYLDGDTQNVFLEVRRFSLPSIEPGPSVTATENGTRLVVNRTYDGGPLRIETVDNATRQPADLPVLVGDTRYRTGEDGVVWALDPAGQTRVVALGRAGNASVTAVPLTPNHVDVGATSAQS